MGYHKGVHNFVGRALQLITWLRMGVPLEVAQWFVNLDKGGFFIIKSPWALHHMRSLTMPGNQLEISALAETYGFQAARGYTQGDVLSTTGWVGFFDILLRALEQVEDVGKFYYRTDGQDLFLQESMAYADDLVTVAATRAQTDSYAKIICGFMALFGLRLAPQKIRSTTKQSPPGVLTYYDWNWCRQTRPFGDANTPITILGILMAASGSWEAQYQHLLLHCHNIAQIVGHKMASLSLKTEVLLSSTLAQILYRTQIVALTPVQLDTLTRVLFKVLRDYRTIGHTFPTRALTTTHMGGIFQDIRAATARRKWGLKGRMIALGGPGEAAMQSLLSRLHRVGFNDLSPSGQTDFLSKQKAGALPRWGDDLPVTTPTGTGLQYIGYDAAIFPQLLCKMVPPPTVDMGEVLEELAIHYRSELTPDGITIPNWLSAANIPEFGRGMRQLLSSNIIQAEIPIDQHMQFCPLAPDQLYTFKEHHYGEIFFEVHGRISANIIAGRWWIRRQRNQKTLLPLDSTEVMHGRAGQGRWQLDELPLEMSCRAITYSIPGEPNQLRLLGIHDNLPGYIPPPHENYMPQWCTDIINNTPATLGIISAMVSDASYIPGTRHLHQLFDQHGPPPYHAQGAFVMFKPGCNRPVLGVIVTGMEHLDKYNAFLGELYCGLGMAQLRSCLHGLIPAWLDCDSALKATDQHLPAESDFYCNLHEDYGVVLHQFHRLRRLANHPSLQWTRGHPDQDLTRRDGTIRPAIPRTEWQQKDYGIYIADHLADLTPLARQTLHTEGLYPDKVVEVSIQDILKAIPTARQWLVCSKAEPSIPIIHPPRLVLEDIAFDEYCTQREETSQRVSKWRSIKIGQLRPTLRQLGALGWASNWAKYMRVILDRLPHGRNLAKGAQQNGTPVEIPCCPLCLSDEDSLEHLTRCQYPSIKDARIQFKQVLHLDIMNYGRREGFTDEAIRLTVAYATACGNLDMDAFDCIGGWIALPTPRFLFLYSPDIVISDKVYRELGRLLPRVISEHIKWLLGIWKTRCTLVHTGNSTTTTSDSQSTTTTTTRHQFMTTLPSFNTRGRRSRQRNRTGSLTQQTSILPYTQGPRPEDEVEADYTPPRDLVNNREAADNTTTTTVFRGEERGWNIGDTLEYELFGSSNTVSEDNPDDELMATPHQNGRNSTPSSSDSTNLEALPVQTHLARGRFTPWNLRGSDSLLEYPSDCPVLPVARTWEELPGTYTPALEGPGYNIPFPIGLRIGPSTLPGAGLGLFIDTNVYNLTAGTAVGGYWGPDTFNQGLPGWLLLPDSVIPEGVREGGAYLLRHGNYMVDADPDCAMGYINEGWEDANASFQPNPRNPYEILIVLKRNLPAHGIYELTVNYGAEYWERLHERLGILSYMKWQHFYSNSRSSNRTRGRTRTKRL